VGLGNQTVVAISLTQTGFDALGTAQFTETRTRVPGCLHRPLRVSGHGSGAARQQKQPEVGVSVATEWWQTHAPPCKAVLNLQASDRLEYEGDVYQIIAGVKPFRDMQGRISHVVILSERQTIG
jgi:hypothetical protein